jgi:hypothetical protein
MVSLRWRARGGGGGGGGRWRSGHLGHRLASLRQRLGRNSSEIASKLTRRPSMASPESRSCIGGSSDVCFGGGKRADGGRVGGWVWWRQRLPAPPIEASWHALGADPRLPRRRDGARDNVVAFSPGIDAPTDAAFDLGLAAMTTSPLPGLVVAAFTRCRVPTLPDARRGRRRAFTEEWRAAVAVVAVVAVVLEPLQPLDLTRNEVPADSFFRSTEIECASRAARFACARSPKSARYTLFTVRGIRKGRGRGLAGQ